MDPCHLDVFHDAADDHPLAVGDGVHVHLGGIVQELVNEDRVLHGVPESRLQIVLELLLLVDDLHGPSAEHVGGPHQHRIADALGHSQGFVRGPGGAVRGLPQLQPFQQLLEAFPVLGQVDAVRRRADDGDAGPLQRQRELQRRLPAELDDDPVGALLRGDVEHVFQRQRFEVELVRGVVVGAHGLRIAVDHQGLEAVLLQGERRVHAAIVELDALADAVGAAAEDHDLLAVAAPGLLGPFVGGVVVGREGLELGSAGIHGAEAGQHSRPRAQRPHVFLRAVRQLRQPPVGEAHVLDLHPELPVGVAGRA